MQPTVKMIVGDKLASGVLDHYLAKTGYQGQQTGELADPNRPNNLWSPVDDTEDHSAHGVFDGRARAWSAQLWANTHRGWLALASAGILSAIAATFLRKQA